MNIDIKKDFISREELTEVQSLRLKKIVAHAYDNVELVRNRMNERGVKPSHINSIKDITLLPFMEKSDLRDTYPYGLFAVPMNDVVRLHASSGTTGKPIVVGYTKDDHDVWASTVRRSLLAYGMNSHDILQNSYGYGLFTGGLGLHAGAESLGCTVIPASGGNTERQLMILRDFGATAISCTPSYFVHMIEESEKMGIDLKSTALKFGIFGAEPWSEGMRKYIEGKTNIRAFDIYGLSEIAGPGVGCECQHQCGIHIFEDYYYPEIIDTKTGEALPDGSEGELVLTTLSKMAMPIFRYRTHDITSIYAEKCACGRTIRRIRRIERRSDDMFIIRGVNVFPSQIEIALMRVEECSVHFRIILERHKDLDNARVEVELEEKYFSDSMAQLESIRKKIQAAIASIIGIRIEVKLVEPHSIQRSEGKAKRVFDNRNI